MAPFAIGVAWGYPFQRNAGYAAVITPIEGAIFFATDEIKTYYALSKTKKYSNNNTVIGLANNFSV